MQLISSPNQLLECCLCRITTLAKTQTNLYGVYKIYTVPLVISKMLKELLKYIEYWSFVSLLKGNVI